MNVILFVITPTKNKPTQFVLGHGHPTINPMAQQQITEGY